MEGKNNIQNQILTLTKSLLEGDYSKRIIVDFEDSTQNQIIQNLNALADKLQIEKRLDDNSTSQNNIINSFVEVISSYSNHDFEKKLEISENGTLLDAIASGVNILGEELKTTTVSKEQLQIERNRLNEAQALAHIGSWEYNLETNEIYWSDEITNILHLEKSTLTNVLDEYKKQIHPTDIDKVEEAIQAAKQNAKESEFETRITCFDNTEKVIHNILTIVKENGRVVQLKGTLQDITDRKKIINELVEAKELAIAADHAKSEFMANVSHELRTPLNGVIGFADLLSQTPLIESQKKYVQIIVQSSNILLTLINDILDFSKLDANEFELNQDKVDLRELSYHVINLIRTQAENKGLKLSTNFTPDIPSCVLVDEPRLKQVLTNLASNALKFTHKGEIELQLSLLGKNMNEAIIRIALRDTGIGVNPNNQKKIFEAFVQEDLSTTKKFGGTGLGLTISNKLLKLMNSELQLISEPGKGSTFYFDLALKIIP